ncbi:MAG: hypothetical protein CVV03_04455 [Firmicutes bacterium HGW-Firmicutes-8]|nr:MAG: hypothetical protein CVV03_04455 [Firmicutes bacterium HGW-Firmicutes-8]
MGFFRQFKDSFTNFDSYRGFAFQRGGNTFKYFFLLFTLIFLISGIKLFFDFNSGQGEIVTLIKEKIPDFRLENGQLTVVGDQPILLDGGNNTIFAVDTTGEIDQTVLDKYDEGIFISKDGAVLKQIGRPVQSIPFSSFRDTKFDKQKLLGLLPMFKWVLIIGGFFAYGFKMAWVLITTLILGLIGLIVNSTMKGRLQFSNTWNAAVYAFTLPWLLELAVDMFFPAIPIFWPIKWGVATFFLYKGIQAAVKIDTPEEPQLPPPNSNIVI